MEHRIFKGATRPPMFMGVPLGPMVLLSMSTIIPFGILFIVQKYIPSLMVLTVFFSVFIWMRITTSTTLGEQNKKYSDFACVSKKATRKYGVA